MKASKKEARIVSLTFLVFMAIIFLSAVATGNMLDVIYILLMILYFSQLIYIRLASDDDDELDDNCL